MCLVLDTNCFNSFFDPDNEEFSPALAWLVGGKGKLVIGGTTYGEELSKAHKYRKMFVNLEKMGKVVSLNLADVDNEEEKVLQIKDENKDFDDPHLVAIIRVSKCKIICTNDKRAHKFLKDKAFYKGCTKPKIYQKKQHKNLLTDTNIVEVCKPDEKLTKSQVNSLTTQLQSR